MDIFAIILVSLQISFLLFQELFSAQGRARAADARFKLDQESLKLIVDAAVKSWASRNSSDSSGAADAWDKADQSTTEYKTD